jgi:hypothetical protein
MDTAIMEYGNESLQPKMFADAQNQIAKHSPEILVGMGIVGVLTSTVLACRATLKAPAVLDVAKQKFADIEDATNQIGVDSPAEYTDEDRKKDLVIASVQTAVDFAKLYGIPVVVMGASLFAICKGHGITLQRNEGLAAAATAMSVTYKAYRNRVADKLGAEKEADLYYGRETREIETESTDAKGKLKTKKEKVTEITLASPDEHSPYSRFFDDVSPQWQNSPELNLTFLLCQQNYANDKLRINKVLFLNEVYDMLGLPRSSAGAVVGWAITPDGDNYVDFGIHTTRTPQGRLFVNGNEASILLDFNVDGLVWELV